MKINRRRVISSNYTLYPVGIITSNLEYRNRFRKGQLSMSERAFVNTFANTKRKDTVQIILESDEARCGKNERIGHGC